MADNLFLLIQLVFIGACLPVLSTARVQGGPPISRTSPSAPLTWRRQSTPTRAPRLQVEHPQLDLSKAQYWSHGWASVQDAMWVDFAGADYAYCPTDAQLQFVATHYQVVSLEKCFAMANYSSNEEAVYAVASKLKTYNPDVRVLFYFHSQKDFGDCYASGKIFESQPAWWLRNDAGQPYGVPNRHEFDLTQDVVREFVAHATVNVTNAAHLLDGVFADGAASTRPAGMNSGRYDEFVKGHRLSLQTSAASSHERIGPNALFLGNALSDYSSVDNHGLDTLPYLDGVVWEHFMAFEMLDSSNGSLVPSLYAQCVDIVINITATTRKPVFIRGWPGPVVTPIGPLGPTWPSSVGPAPDTHASRAAAAAKWLDISLAGYLILAQPNTYWSYNWWYTAPDGVYPCQQPDGACSAPQNWYPQLSKPLGPPMGPHTRDGWIFTRSFAHATVVFNATDVSKSSISWHGPESLPT